MKKNSVVLIGMLIITMLLTGCQIFISFGVRPKGVRGWIYENKSHIVVMPNEGAPRGYQPLSSAKVDLYTSNYAYNERVAWIKTEKDGSFYLDNVSPGEYLLVIEHPNGYQKVQIAVYALGSPRRVIAKESRIHYVIVGIDEYPKLIVDDENSYGRTPEDLDVSARDAQAIKEAFVKGNLMVGSCETLINSEATRNNIRKEIENAARRAKPVDFLVFYFSGYADQELYDGEFIYPLDHIVPYDGQNYGSLEQIRNSLITDKDLESWLSKFPNSNVTVILEVAYAQTFFDGVPRDKVKTSSMIEPLALKNTGYTVLGATSEDKRTWVKPGEGSLFTSALLDGLNKIRSDAITAWGLYEYARNEIKRKGIPQDPRFEGPGNTLIYIRDSFYW